MHVSNMINNWYAVMIAQLSMLSNILLESFIEHQKSLSLQSLLAFLVRWIPLVKRTTKILCSLVFHSLMTSEFDTHFLAGEYGNAFQKVGMGTNKRPKFTDRIETSRDADFTTGQRRTLNLRTPNREYLMCVDWSSCSSFHRNWKVSVAVLYCCFCQVVRVQR